MQRGTASRRPALVPAVVRLTLEYSDSAISADLCEALPACCQDACVLPGLILFAGSEGGHFGYLAKGD